MIDLSTLAPRGIVKIIITHIILMYICSLRLRLHATFTCLFIFTMTGAFTVTECEPVYVLFP